MKRFKTIKELIPKSIDKTLEEVRCKKYEGDITYLSTLPELESWNDDFFWKLMINELSAYCDKLAHELFPERQDVQTSDALKRCMEECALVDIMKGAVVFDGNKKERLLPKDTVVHSVALQSVINESIGTKLDIVKWKETGDRNKVYAKYGQMIQKQAMTSGKNFIKLLKVHKIRKHKEKKQRILELENEKLKKKTEETEEAAEPNIVKKGECIDERETANDTTIHYVESTKIEQQKEKEVEQEKHEPIEDETIQNNVNLNEIVQQEEKAKIKKNLSEETGNISANDAEQIEDEEKNGQQDDEEQSMDKNAHSQNETNEDNPLRQYQNYAMLFAFLVVILGIICTNFLTN